MPDPNQPNPSSPYYAPFDFLQKTFAPPYSSPKAAYDAAQWLGGYSLAASSPYLMGINSYLPTGYWNNPPPRAQASLPSLTASSFGASPSGAGRYYSPVGSHIFGAGGSNLPQRLADWQSNFKPLMQNPEGTLNASTANPNGAGNGAPTPPQSKWGGQEPYRQRMNQKMGDGWFESFAQAHGKTPLEFYADPRNWFSYQRQAAEDYGINSKQFADATERAAIDEGMKHQDEVAQWQQLHGNTPIPDEMWKRWYEVNRGNWQPNENGKLGDGNPVVY